MRATEVCGKVAASFEEAEPALQILILHEDFSAYSHAVEICRLLMQRFAGELDFNIKCWNFIELADPNYARHAARTAGMADLILLSTQTPRLPAELDWWLDTFFVSRFRPDGALALILNAPCRPHPALENLGSRLKVLADRLGMDFILLPPNDDTAIINLSLGGHHPGRDPRINWGLPL